jgi:HlyD family secretion protein
VRGNVASAKDLEKASEATAIADAEHASAVAGLRETEKRLIAAERGLEVQRARLDDTTIEAPFDALVVRRDRDPGDVVTAGSSILRIVSTDEMWITAWVDETELAHLAADQPARVTFRSEPDVEYPGRVARIGREADRETREVVVDVRLSELPARWAVGQRADVMIEAARRDDVVVLPADLLRMREGAPGVFIDEDGRARWRPVTVGARGRTQVEVVAGLSAGDVVVHPAGAPNDPIREGRRIRAQ